jgi:hypothetical protein
MQKGQSAFHSIFGVAGLFSNAICYVWLSVSLRRQEEKKDEGDIDI